VTTKEGDVTGLDLSFNNLDGTIPPSFTFLTALRTLDLRNNSLAGELPIVLTMIPALQYLDVAANAFTGRQNLLLDSQNSLMIEKM
jgi:hypothetical protein